MRRHDGRGGPYPVDGGKPWAPVEVQFAHPAPLQTSEHGRVFRAPVWFGCRINALAIEREFVERQVPAADERLYPVLTRYLDRALKEMPREDGHLASVRRAVGESLRDGDRRSPRWRGSSRWDPGRSRGA